jgi:hypothetical protein
VERREGGEVTSGKPLDEDLVLIMSPNLKISYPSGMPGASPVSEDLVSREPGQEDPGTRRSAADRSAARRQTLEIPGNSARVGWTRTAGLPRSDGLQARQTRATRYAQCGVRSGLPSFPSIRASGRGRSP